MIKTVQYCFEQYFNGKLNDLLKKEIGLKKQRPRNISLKIKQILYNRDPEM